MGEGPDGGPPVMQLDSHGKVLGSHPGASLNTKVKGVPVIRLAGSDCSVKIPG